MSSPITQPDPLRANLAQLARMDPELARRIEGTAPAALEWTPSRAGALSAVLTVNGRAVTLASKYDPPAEAKQLLAQVDPAKHGAVAVLGFGLGYHAALASEMLGSERSVVIVFEPDLAVLRAVLERVDHTAWLGRPNLVLIAGSIDRAGLLQRLEHFGSIMAQGTMLVAHPPTRQLHADAIKQFGELVTDVLAYVRTNVATALVNSARTFRNQVNNIAYYAAGANTNELHRAAVGVPAVCVGAGPSLAKNLHLLMDAAVREKVIVIAAQTTLKPLLQRGIRPDFVTALDYHEISRRFYEGLPRLDGERPVTLVAEAKANRAIIDNYPGPIRVTASGFCDRLLGPLAQPIKVITPGATVAHLSFYLAQHLGCDPIILIGQDLGFSDGLYYCPGTAIHEVWQPELNQFNSVEMMEWQRIVRHRGFLQRMDDVHGQPIFTDEQMVTYLRQFERDFADAPQTVIDATEGGVPKEHTQRMTLADALARYAQTPAPTLPVPEMRFDLPRVELVIELLRNRLFEVNEIRRLSRQTIPLLRQMKEHQRDYHKAKRIFRDIERCRKDVDKYHSTFALVNELNTIGAFRRARADRAIAHSGTESFARQAAQIDRDIDNLDWLLQACDEATATLKEGLERTQELARQWTARQAGPAVGAA